MIAGVVPEHPDPGPRGEMHGQRFRTEVRHNIARFKAAAFDGGWDWRRLEQAAADVAATQAPSTLTDLEFLDLTLVVSYFNYINHIATSLGVDPEAAHNSTREIITGGVAGDPPEHRP